MRRTRKLLVSGLVLGLVAVSGCGSGESGDGASKALSARTETIQLFVLPSSFGRLDLGSRGRTGGEEFFFNQGLAKKRTGRRVTQRVQAVCVRTAPGNGEVFQCSLSVLLNDGSLQAIGVATRRGIRDATIVGGTGKYAGAEGTLVYERQGSELTLTLTVNSPARGG